MQQDALVMMLPFPSALTDTATIWTIFTPSHTFCLSACVHTFMPAGRSISALPRSLQALTLGSLNPEADARLLPHTCAAVTLEV